MNPRWIVVQLGSREQYSVARAINASGMLFELVTDFWMVESSWIRRLKKSAGSRFHKDLSRVDVRAFNLVMFLPATIDRIAGNYFRRHFGIMTDRFFSYFALRHLKRNLERYKNAGVTHIFAYNYYSAELFQWATAHGFKCILGQIDAGPAAGNLVRMLAARYDLDAKLFHDHYLDYRSKWNIETSLASMILVNSDWSKEMLMREGVREEQIRIVPLCFEKQQSWKTFTRESFDQQNPLKVLILGSLQIQKGVVEVFEAARSLRKQPVKFTFAGGLKMPIKLLERMPAENCLWLGYQRGAQFEKLFETNDVLLFATHSDGFGLVQLEAMAHNLPIISSRFCGRVVESGVNGFILPEVSPKAIEDVIHSILNDPRNLRDWTSNAILDGRFTFVELVNTIRSIN